MQLAGDAGVSPYAATLRNVDGEIVGTTWAGTMCEHPRRPWKLAAVSADGERETVLRCHACDGCLEFDRRRLVERLRKFAEPLEGGVCLHVLRFTEPRTNSDLRSVRRRMHVKPWPGFLGISPQAAVLVTPKRPSRADLSMLSSHGLCASFKLSTTSSKLIWRKPTAGMLLPRQTWGRHTKRYYFKGLPAAERERWGILTRGGIRSRHRQFGRGVRAVAGDVALMPPAIWRSGRPERAKKQTDKLRDVPRKRPRSDMEALGQVLAGMGVAPLPLTARGASRAPALTLKFDAAAKPHPPLLKRIDHSFDRGVTKDVNPTKPESYLEWGERMAAKARERDRGG